MIKGFLLFFVILTANADIVPSGSIKYDTASLFVVKGIVYTIYEDDTGWHCALGQQTMLNDLDFNPTPLVAFAAAHYVAPTEETDAVCAARTPSAHWVVAPRTGYTTRPYYPYDMNTDVVGKKAGDVAIGSPCTDMKVKDSTGGNEFHFLPMDGMFIAICTKVYQ